MASEQPQSVGSIEGQVVDDTGRPLADVTVMIKTSDQPHPDIAAVTDDTGTFGLYNLPEGRYVLAAHGSSEHSTEAEVIVLPGRANRVQLVINP